MSTAPEHRNRNLEDLVEEFLDRRQREPGLSPESFAEQQPGAGPRLLAALHASLDVLAALGEDATPLPEAIGPFRVVRELGRGGMGVVYEVEKGGKRFALKRLSAVSLLHSRAKERFQREARALLRLRHPGVVAVREVGVADGLPFIVMELVSGRSLDEIGPLHWRRAAELVRDIARSMAAVHEAGLCHRDLKPSNVVVKSDDTPVVVDFGLVHDDEEATLTSTGDLIGTPRYLAPEQAEGRPTDERTDVHALGLILAELVTGLPPRSGTERSELLAAAARGLAPDLRRMDPDAPRALRKIVHTATARLSHQRYPTAATMADDLDRLLAGRAVAARPPGTFARARDTLRFHPRAAGALAAGSVALLTAGALLLQASRAEARALRARQHFESAVLAWWEGDGDGQRAATEATLAEEPAHHGALVLNALLSGAALPPAADGYGASLCAGLRHRAEGHWVEAAAEFRTATRSEPGCPLAHILMAEAEERSGRLADADSELAAASRLLPGSASLAAALGEIRMRRGDAKAAAVEYRRASDLQPDSFHLRYQLARALYSFDAEGGLHEVDGAAALLSPGDNEGWCDLRNLRASLLDKLGRTEEALSILRDLAAREPENARFCFNLAYALDRLQRVREAKHLYEKALSLDPGNRRAALCLVWLLATAEEEDLRDTERAERLLVEALERDRGRTVEVLQMVREFALRTGRTDNLVRVLDRLSALPDTSSQDRATLEHTRNYIRSGAPRSGR